MLYVVLEVFFFLKISDDNFFIKKQQIFQHFHDGLLYFTDIQNIINNIIGKELLNTIRM